MAELLAFGDWAFTTVQDTMIVCLLAFAAVPANQYAIFENYFGKTCGKSDASGVLSAYPLGVCSGKEMASASPNGTISITSFEDQSCTKAKTVCVLR